MKIVVLAGGLSPERNVSLSSGAMVCQALRERGHQVALVDLFFGLDDWDKEPEALYGAPIPEAFLKVSRQAPDLDEVRESRKTKGPSAIGPGVLDLCAGSGCVGLAIASQVPSCRVVLGDLSEGALRTCKQNVRRNGLNARVTCLSVDALDNPSPALWDFDVIVCNPPYIPSGDIAGLDASVRDYEPRMALDGGEDGLDYYRAIAPKWKAALRLGGALLFEVGIGQAPAVEEILAQNGYQDIQSAQDTQGIWRVVEGTARD